jgi:hypothetical protein
VSIQSVELLMPISVASGGAGDESCGGCRFWADRGGFRGGLCRRHAPGAREPMTGEVWPVVPAGAWCGEYEAALPAPAPEVGDVDSLDLRGYTARVLRQSRFGTVAAVMEAADWELLAVPGLGRQSLREIRQAVAARLAGDAA